LLYNFDLFAMIVWMTFRNWCSW